MRAGMNFLGATAGPDIRHWSRTGENPPYGIFGGTMETSASFDARSAPSSYPTASESAVLEVLRLTPVAWRLSGRRLRRRSGPRERAHSHAHHLTFRLPWNWKIWHWFSLILTHSQGRVSRPSEGCPDKKDHAYSRPNVVTIRASATDKPQNCDCKEYPPSSPPNGRVYFSPAQHKPIAAAKIIMCHGMKLSISLASRG